MEYEERNAALQKHVESMRGAVERLESDVMQERERNGLLHQHLETLRQALTSSFSSVPLPGESSCHLIGWWCYRGAQTGRPKGQVGSIIYTSHSLVHYKNRSKY